jgi:hypothetical protein
MQLQACSPVDGLELYGLPRRCVHHLGVHQLQAGGWLPARQRGWVVGGRCAGLVGSSGRTACLRQQRALRVPLLSCCRLGADALAGHERPMWWINYRKKAFYILELPLAQRALRTAQATLSPSLPSTSRRASRVLSHLIRFRDIFNRISLSQGGWNESVFSSRFRNSRLEGASGLLSQNVPLLCYIPSRSRRYCRTCRDVEPCERCRRKERSGDVGAAVCVSATCLLPTHTAPLNRDVLLACCWSCCRRLRRHVYISENDKPMKQLDNRPLIRPTV